MIEYFSAECSVFPPNTVKSSAVLFCPPPASCLRWCRGDRIAVGQEGGTVAVVKVAVFGLQPVAKSE